MQHGEAMTETDDPARPLSGAGRAAVGRVAARVQAAGVLVDLCVHSGKRRAEQTAHLLANAVGADGHVEAREGLAPNDPVAPVAQWLRGLAEDQAIALVGHLPFLERLASLLVADDERVEVIHFQMGGLVKLESKQERAGFAVAWALAPEIA